MGEEPPANFYQCYKMRNFLTVVTIVLYLKTSLISAGKKVQDLQIIVEHKPDTCKDLASIGDTVNVEYTGMLTDGRIFDTSMRDGRSPLRFTLGSGTLIKGWERGIHGMCMGERRKLVIPPHLGYGSKTVGNVIPPDSTLIFTVHLVGLEKKSFMSKIKGLSTFAIWPLCFLAILFYLYRKTKNAPEVERKSEKRVGKKKR